jgi:hypothetical protein
MCHTAGYMTVFRYLYQPNLALTVSFSCHHYVLPSLSDIPRDGGEDRGLWGMWLRMPFNT